MSEILTKKRKLTRNQKIQLVGVLVAFFGICITTYVTLLAPIVGETWAFFLEKRNILPPPTKYPLIQEGTLAGDDSDSPLPTQVIQQNDETESYPSEFEPLIISVLGTNSDGIQWCSLESRTYTISYFQGAYSAWPNDNSCASFGCWETSVFLYIDRPVTWIQSGTEDIPSAPDFEIGWHLPAFGTKEGAESFGRQSSPVVFDLSSGSCIIFIPLDGHLSYQDNRERVEIMIESE